MVLATNIAETSLTIEGIKIVIDSGFARRTRFDPNSGLSRLETVHISQESADQRAGRAGRLSPGVCYRMWTKVTHSRMEEQSTPELSLHCWKNETLYPLKQVLTLTCALKLCGDTAVKKLATNGWHALNR